ncbi:MAG: translation initiation factor IF-1 [Minisyncoccia bacterium]
MLSNKKEKTSVVGIVTEAFPNTLFKVKPENSEEEMLTFLSGKMRLHRIRILIGDKVEVEIDPYGGKGKIIKRF